MTPWLCQKAGATSFIFARQRPLDWGLSFWYNPDMILRRDIAGGTPTPSWVDPLVRPFGLNPFGEPVFRVLHSPRHIICIGGYWQSDGMFEYRHVRRYPGKKCWVLERWLPARHYGSPVSWKDDTINPEGYLSLGPYPLYGLFECCLMLLNVPLCPQVITEVLSTLWVNRVRKTSDIREALERDIKAEEILWDEQFERDYDATHGVRHGTMSLTGGKVLTYNSDEIERYKEKLIASGVRVKREDFKEGFQQFENK